MLNKTNFYKTVNSILNKDNSKEKHRRNKLKKDYWYKLINGKITTTNYMEKTKKLNNYGRL